MNETIRIHNFVLIQEVELHFTKINLLVGPQASGKSLIAKLCYFFKNISTYIYLGGAVQQNKRELDKVVFADFCSRFPRSAWEGTEFDIEYQYADFCVTLSGVKNKNNKTSLIMRFNKKLMQFYTKLKNNHKKVKNEKSELLGKMDDYSALLRLNILMPFLNSAAAILSEDVFPVSTFFIPAARSFFANIQDNIFTLLGYKVQLDPFITGFGAIYEATKNDYTQRFDQYENSALMQTLDQLQSLIIDGQYAHVNQKDYIIQDGRKVDMSYASSGQQEALPMLLILLMYSLKLQAKNFFLSRNRKPIYSLLRKAR